MNGTEDREHWTAEDYLAELEEDCWPMRDVLDKEMRQDFDEVWSRLREDATGVAALNPRDRGLMLPSLLLICIQQQFQIRRLCEILDVDDLEERDVLRWDLRDS
jgi:hypothetical protein